MAPREELEIERFSVPLGMDMGALGSSEGGTYTLGTDLFNSSIRGPSLGEIESQCHGEGHPLFLVSEWNLWRKARLTVAAVHKSLPVFSLAFLCHSLGEETFALWFPCLEKVFFFFFCLSQLSKNPMSGGK